MASGAARALARKLRDGDPEMIALLRDLLRETRGDLDASAKAVGLAGKSTLWRVAYGRSGGCAAVRLAIAELGRAPGRQREDA